MGSLGTILKKIRSSSGWDASYSYTNYGTIVAYLNNYQNYIEYCIPVTYGTGEYISSLSIQYDLWSTSGTGRTVTAYAYLFGTDFSGSSISGYVQGYQQTVYNVTTANAQRTNFTFTESDLSSVRTNQYLYILIATNSTNIQSYTTSSGYASGPTISATFGSDYVVSYDPNGGSSIPLSQRKKAGESVTLGNAISKADTVNKYTLTPNANGGTLANSNTGTCTKTTSYSFNGWYSSADKKLYQAGSTYSYDASTTMTAQWITNSSNYVTDISNLNDPTYINSNSSYIVPYNDGTSKNNVILVGTCTVKYKFNGWYTSSSSGSKITSTTQFNSNSNIYAQWSSLNTDIEYLTINSVTLPSLTRTGYVLKGYNRPEAVSTIIAAGSYTPEEKYVKNPVLLTAVWTANTYTVTLNPNTGSLDGITTDPIDIDVTYGSAYGTLKIPQKAGYFFDGWYTAVSGGTKITSDTIVSTASNHTLYAHWYQVFGYKLNFNINGGTGTIPSTIQYYGSDQTYKATWDVSTINITKTNSKWIGWSTSPTGELLDGGTSLSSYIINSTGSETIVTLYAIYETNGAITIHNGTSFVKGLVYVHDGEQWRLCIPYINNGSEWKIGE